MSAATSLASNAFEMWYFVLGRVQDKPTAVVFRQCRAGIFADLAEAMRFCDEVYEGDEECLLELTVVPCRQIFGIDFDEDAGLIEDLAEAWKNATIHRRKP